MHGAAPRQDAPTPPPLRYAAVFDGHEVSAPLQWEPSASSLSRSLTCPLGADDARGETCVLRLRPTKHTPLSTYRATNRPHVRIQAKVLQMPVFAPSERPTSLCLRGTNTQGTLASEFARSCLHVVLAAELRACPLSPTITTAAAAAAASAAARTAVANALRRAIVRVDGTFLQRTPPEVTDGSTVLVVLQWGAHLLAANVGDSPAYLCHPSTPDADDAPPTLLTEYVATSLRRHVAARVRCTWIIALCVCAATAGVDVWFVLA